MCAVRKPAFDLAPDQGSGYQQYMQSNTGPTLLVSGQNTEEAEESKEREEEKQRLHDELASEQALLQKEQEHLHQELAAEQKEQEEEQEHLRQELADEAKQEQKQREEEREQLRKELAAEAEQERKEQEEEQKKEQPSAPALLAASASGPRPVLLGASILAVGGVVAGFAAHLRRQRQVLEESDGLLYVEAPMEV